MVHSELGNTSSSLSCSHQIVHFLKNLRCQIASVSATFMRVENNAIFQCGLMQISILDGSYSRLQTCGT